VTSVSGKRGSILKIRLQSITLWKLCNECNCGSFLDSGLWLSHLVSEFGIKVKNSCCVINRQQDAVCRLPRNCVLRRPVRCLVISIPPRRPAIIFRALHIESERRQIRPVLWFGWAFIPWTSAPLQKNPHRLRHEILHRIAFILPSLRKRTANKKANFFVFVR